MADPSITSKYMNYLPQLLLLQEQLEYFIQSDLKSLCTYLFVTFRIFLSDFTRHNSIVSYVSVITQNRIIMIDVYFQNSSLPRLGEIYI